MSGRNLAEFAACILGAGLLFIAADRVLNGPPRRRHRRKGRRP